jgi:hypothetical protein
LKAAPRQRAQRLHQLGHAALLAERFHAHGIERFEARGRVDLRGDLGFDLRQVVHVLVTGLETEKGGPALKARPPLSGRKRL